MPRRISVIGVGTPPPLIRNLMPPASDPAGGGTSSPLALDTEVDFNLWARAMSLSITDVARQAGVCDHPRQADAS